MDNIIRDYFLTDNKKSLNKITENEAGYIGQSIWNYISITYGKNTISNIINLTKLLRNPEKAISSSLGINFIQRYKSKLFLSAFSNSSLRLIAFTPDFIHVIPPARLHISAINFSGKSR